MTRKDFELIARTISEYPEERNYTITYHCGDDVHIPNVHVRDLMSYIDTRDLDAELTELETQLEDAFLDAEERERLDALRTLRDEIGGEWSYGATMIPESDFEDYARELAEDIGAIDPAAGWPLYCIDWERAARDLAMDYTTVEWEGDTYYVRS